MTLWRVDGIASTDGATCGTLTMWVVTPDASRPPDVNAALAECEPRSEWVEVNSVRVVARLPRSWTDASGRPNLVALAEAAEVRSLPMERG